MTTPARKTQLPVIHEISVPFAYNTAGIAAGVQIGTVPAGAYISSIDLFITAGFNAGTTNTLSVGTTGTGTDLVNATAAGSAALTKTNCPIAKAAVAADTPLYVSYAQSGTAASAGAGVAVVTYIPTIG